MKRRWIRSGFLLWVLGWSACVARSEGETLSKAEVFAAFKTVRPGDFLPLAVRLTVADGWHTYAEEPGDSGMPPLITVRGVDGLEQAAWRFPPFQTFSDSSGTTYGYEKSVVLLGGVRIPSALPEGLRMELNVTFEWMICRDICVFLQDKQILLIQTGPVSSEPAEEWTALLEEGVRTDIEPKQGTGVPGKESR